MSERTPTRRSARSRSSASGDRRSEGSADLDMPVSSPLIYGSPSDPGNRSERIPNSEFDISSPLEYGTPSSVASARTPRSGGIRGTPIRQRRDVSSNRHVRQVQMGSIPEGAEASSEHNVGNEAPQLVVWGTDVVVNTCKDKFKKFVTSFVNPMIDEDERSKGLTEDRPFYLQKLEEIENLDQPFLQLNCAHIQSYDGDLYRQLICYPQEVIPTFDMAINELFFEQYPDGQLQYQIQVRPFNAEKTKNMRLLNPEDIDQLISVSGMVMRTSNIIPEMREAFFRCSLCFHSVSVELDRGRIAEPTHCANCNTNHSYTLIHNRSRFTDKQMIKMQESNDDRPAGQTPHTILMYAYNDLVDAVHPGDRVTVTGIYRAVPIRANPRQNTLKAVYKTHVDIVHYRKVDSKRLHEHNDEKEIQLTKERIEQLKALSETPDVYDRLSRALAPSIFGNEDIKKGILLQLFGGTKKDFEGTGKGRFRSDINILLCGDPGTSKSQLLTFVHRLVPRGQYTSGKGSSAVGLTAYVTKDPESRQLVLQTGALVLSDNGVCCIDEFDKMNDATRSVLHEVMEQQTLSIAKAGIICQLNARASILAAANPCESQWNKNKTIIENIQLPPTLLSRFDLIFLMLDPQDEAFDRRLARHLVSLYYKTGEDEDLENVDSAIMKDYIAYARGSVHPKLSEEAGESLVHAYVEMRKIGSGRGQVTAYPRQLESLIRLSEAHAKMRLSSWVQVADVEEAKRIHREALKQSATDPSSGKIDVSILTTGLSSDARRRRTEMVETFKRMVKEKGANVSTLNYQKTFSEMRELMDIQLTRDMFEEILQLLQDDGYLIVASKTTLRIL